MFKTIVFSFLLSIVFIACNSEKKVRIVNELEQGEIFINDKKVAQIRISYATLFLEEGKHHVFIKKLSKDKEWLYVSSKEIRVNDKEVQVFDFDNIEKSATSKRKERLKKEEEQKTLLFNKLGLKQAPSTYVYVDTKNELVWNNNVSKKRYLSWNQANDYCKELDLQGINTWRMPFIKELKTLIDKRNRNHMNSGIQKISNKGVTYWSRENSSTNSAYKKTFKFSWLSESQDPSWAKFSHVICVKSANSTLEKRLSLEELHKAKEQKNKKKIAKVFGLKTYPRDVFLDTRTKLIWQNNQDGISENKRNASVYCKNLRQVVSKDILYKWRLPSVEELQTLFKKPKPKYLNLINSSHIGYETADKKGYTSNILVYENGTVKKSYASYMRCVSNVY